MDTSVGFEAAGRQVDGRPERTKEIPVEYLIEASDESLGGLELKQRELAATLRKEARQLEARAVEHIAAAEVALYLRRNRLEILFARAVSKTAPIQNSSPAARGPLRALPGNERRKRA